MCVSPAFFSSWECASTNMFYGNLNINYKYYECSLIQMILKSSYSSHSHLVCCYIDENVFTLIIQLKNQIFSTVGSPILKYLLILWIELYCQLKQNKKHLHIRRAFKFNFKLCHSTIAIFCFKITPSILFFSFFFFGRIKRANFHL